MNKTLRGGLAALALLTPLAVAACGTSHPAAAMPPASQPAATAPAAASGPVGQWWTTAGHDDTAAVLHDALKITGDYRGTTAQLPADGQKLSADAQTALNDYLAAYGPAWATAPAGQEVSYEFTEAMGQYKAAGDGLAASVYPSMQGTDTSGAYDSGIGIARQALDRVNAALAGLGLHPAPYPSIDSPDA
jgi:hypothetical protein